MKLSYAEWQEPIPYSYSHVCYVLRPDMRPDSTRTARVHGTRLAFARRAPHLRKPSPLWCAIHQQLLCSSQARRQGAHARRLDDDSLEAAPVADAQLLEQGQCVERTARARQASDVDTDELRQTVPKRPSSRFRLRAPRLATIHPTHPLRPAECEGSADGHAR